MWNYNLNKNFMMFALLRRNNMFAFWVSSSLFYYMQQRVGLNSRVKCLDTCKLRNFIMKNLKYSAD